VTSGPADRQDTKPPSRAFSLAIAGLLAVGVALRVAMGFESFWLDEVWSLAIARQARTALEIFTGFHHDNNHLLNTLYLRAVDGPLAQAHWFLFRIPAEVTGAVSLAVLYRIGRRWGRAEAAFVLALAATSYPLVSASAQARGYAGAILCSLVYFALDAGRDTGRDARTREWLRDIGLWAVAAVGLLFHPTFAYGLAGVLAWRLALVLGGGSRGHDLRRVARAHGVPLLLTGLAYALFYADLQVGGGPRYDRFTVVRQAIAQTMALPRRGPLTWVATGIAGVLAFQAGRVLVRTGDRRIVLLGVTIGVAPAAIILFADPELLYARYLLVAFPWFYLLVAIGLGDAWRQGRAGRLAATLVLAGFVAANTGLTARVLAEGRDDYARTLAYMDQQTTGPVIRVGGDHDFRNRLLLGFYAPGIASGRPVVYLTRDQWPPEGPEWYLRHDWKAGHDPDPVFMPVPGLHYQRVVTFEHGPGDGFQWFVYRRQP
jgi:hypothetical protein